SQPNRLAGDAAQSVDEFRARRSVEIGARQLPIAAQPQLPPGLRVERQLRSRRELHDSIDDRLVALHGALREKTLDRRAIDAPRHNLAAEREQGTKLAGEDETSRGGTREIHRLDAEAVARDQHAVGRALEQCVGEHAAEVLYGVVAPRDVRAED